MVTLRQEVRSQFISFELDVFVDDLPVAEVAVVENFRVLQLLLPSCVDDTELSISVNYQGRVVVTILE